jgi:serine/threonine-protein kinase
MAHIINAGRPRLGPTVAYPTAEPSPAPARRPRCRFARAGAPAPDTHGDLHRLLQSRLRLASLITLVPFLYFLVRHVLQPDAFGGGASALVVHAVATAVTASLTAWIWLRRCAGWFELRAAELSLFGGIAAYFAWLQYEMIASGYIDKWATEGQVWTVMRLAMSSCTLRWFFLIVMYGVFIPNTWKRCAKLTVLVALIPLVVSVLAAYQNGRLGGEMLTVLFDTGLLMAVGVAVGVFGSYRIQVLQEQAHEAKQLGQYRLKQKLGAGGMGEVYLAEHTLLRRPCAVKLIRPDQTADPANLARFEREVQAMAKLTHWNTVEIFDYGHAEDGTFYYVMEYLPGSNLEALVEGHGPLPAGRVIHFLRQMCRALREAHGVGMLHRDVKPSNVLACERGGVHDVAKLLDFGLVQAVGLDKTADKLTVRGAILGSPPFMSPEQAAGKEDLDARSDIYGVGGVAYFLLTGHQPFERETAMMMLMAHAYEPVAPPSQLRPDVPADLEAVVLRCLAKKPDERYPDADSLEKALAACAAAGDWTEETAAAWWKSQPPPEAGAEETVTPAEPVGMATRV